MISRARKLALGGVAGTVIVTAVSILGPELFSSWWNSDREKAESESRQIQLEAIREQTEVISNLRDAISALQDARPAAQAGSEPPVPVQEERKAADPAGPEVPVSTPDEPAEDEGASAPPASHVEAEQPSAEPPVIAEPPAIAEEPAPAPATPAPPFRLGDVLGVFENEPFTLCGHAEFRANLREGADGQRLHVASRNRSVPGAGFRGYETLLPLERAVELWEGCVVAAAISPSPGGRRILISTGEQ